MLINTFYIKRKRMIFSSNRLNLTILHCLMLLISLAGMFFVEFTLHSLFTTFACFYVLNLLGNWMTLHRYYSHKSFKFKNKILEQFFTIIAILSLRGSILGWVYIHRQHHAYADTEKDPHCPALGVKLFGFSHYKNIEEEKFKLFLIKDLMTKYHLFVHKYYFLLILTIVLFLAIIDINVLYFGYAVPCVLTHISQNVFNYYGHTQGYRNFNTKDNSTNNSFMFPLILGKCWHNNHHHQPKYYSTKVKNVEIDPLGNFIRVIGHVNK